MVKDIRWNEGLILISMLLLVLGLLFYLLAGGNIMAIVGITLLALGGAGVVCGAVVAVWRYWNAPQGSVRLPIPSEENRLIVPPEPLNPKPRGFLTVEKKLIVAHGESLQKLEEYDQKWEQQRLQDRAEEQRRLTELEGRIDNLQTNQDVDSVVLANPRGN